MASLLFSFYIALVTKNNFHLIMIARKLSVEKFLLLLIIWTLQSPNHSTMTLACTSNKGDFEIIGSDPTATIICKNCFGATITGCANAFCIGDKVCGDAFFRNVKYKNASRRMKSNAACGVLK
jgi:hypothetical protein